MTVYLVLRSLLVNVALATDHRRRLFVFLPRAKGELPPSSPALPFLFSPLPKYSQGVWASAETVSSPSEVWGEAPADKRFDAHWSQKAQLCWQQFLLIFLRRNAIFCTETSLISYGVKNCRWVQFLTVRRPMSSFSPGAVATIALWKSAPMARELLLQRPLTDLLRIAAG